MYAFIRKHYRRGWFLAAVFLAAVSVRMAVSIWQPAGPSPDEPSWRLAGADLAAGHGFTNIRRHPGYVLLLAGVYRLSGNTSDLQVRAAQALLCGLQSALLFYMALWIFRRESAACLAAVMFAFYPYSVFQSTQILSESLYSFLLTGFMAMLCRFRPGHVEPASAPLAGIFFGLAVLTKSTVLIFVPWLLLWFALNRVQLRSVLLFVMPSLLLVLPFTAHNYGLFGKLVPVTPSGSFLFEANNHETMRIELATRRLEEVSWVTEEHREIGRLPAADAEREYTLRAKNFIKENPGKVLSLMRMRFFHFWRFYPVTRLASHRMAALATSGVYIPLSLLGLWWFRRNWRRTFIIPAMVLSFNFAHLFFVCTLRYRIPLDPFFMIFAAYALTVIFEKVRPSGASTEEYAGTLAD